VQDERIEGVEVASLCILDEGLFVHRDNFITVCFLPHRHGVTKNFLRVCG
jgi:hypothetical protein